MRDIIDATIEGLIESGHPEYVERSRQGHAMKDAVLPGMIAMAKDQTHCAYRAMTQALFESGFLTTSERCFNLDMLIALVYGTKVHGAIPTFLNLWDQLTARGFTSLSDRHAMYNPYGDNYFSAVQYQINPDEDDYKVREIARETAGGNQNANDDDFRKDVFRKVIYIENQSPAWAVVLENSLYTNTPDKLHLLQLKEDYNDPDVLAGLHAMEFDVAQQFKWSAYGSRKTINKIVTTLEVDKMECKPVLDPKAIEHILFDIYSGFDSIEQDRLNTQPLS